MSSDGRAAAWIQCWVLLEAATKLLVSGELSDQYWGMISAAATYAELANSKPHVGLIAGDWLEQRGKSQCEKTKSHIDEFLKDEK